MLPLVGDRTASSPAPPLAPVRPVQNNRLEKARGKGCPSCSGSFRSGSFRGGSFRADRGRTGNPRCPVAAGGVSTNGVDGATTVNGQSEMVNGQSEPEGDDFYSVLGVSPNANNSELKKAYYAIMRDYHPDISTDEEANEFCTFLNEIYETLTDPEKRAIYDEIAGFSFEAVNPFEDDSYAKDKVFVDEFTCIGCKNCCNVCPSTFAIEDDYGRSRVMAQGSSSTVDVQEAIDTCPVDCIYWVTAPQLTLLESAMMSIERVAVWIMMNGTGGGYDVFQEAYRAFEKRQAEQRRRQNASNEPNWAENVIFRREHQSSAEDVQRRAAAAQAASSARKWRDYQRNQRQKDTLRLPATNGSTAASLNGNGARVDGVEVLRS